MDLKYHLEDSFEILKTVGGWYQCSKDSLGRMSPLVGYTKRDQFGKQFVGEEYVNFAKIEENIDIVHHLALLLRTKISKDLLSSCDIICGIPEGGKILGAMLAFVCCKKFKYPDKKLIPSKIPGERDETIFTFGRHKIRPGEKVILVEDVTSSFTSVQKVIEEIDKKGGFVTAIVTFFNRSMIWDDLYYSRPDERCEPIISLIRKRIPQYPQDNPFVLDDIKKGNVVWDPKNNWGQLVPWSC